MPGVGRPTQLQEVLDEDPDGSVLCGPVPGRAHERFDRLVPGLFAGSTGERGDRSASLEDPAARSSRGCPAGNGPARCSLQEDGEGDEGQQEQHAREPQHRAAGHARTERGRGVDGGLEFDACPVDPGNGRDVGGDLRMRCLPVVQDATERHMPFGLFLRDGGALAARTARLLLQTLQLIVEWLERRLALGVDAAHVGGALLALACQARHLGRARVTIGAKRGDLLGRQGRGRRPSGCARGLAGRRLRCLGVGRADQFLLLRQGGARGLQRGVGLRTTLRGRSHRGVEPRHLGLASRPDLRLLFLQPLRRGSQFTGLGVEPGERIAPFLVAGQIIPASQAERPRVARAT